MRLVLDMNKVPYVLESILRNLHEKVEEHWPLQQLFVQCPVIFILLQYQNGRVRGICRYS